MCVADYINYLKEEEKSESTIKQYEREINQFNVFINERNITKDLVIAYKENLKENHKISSVNTKLVAINGYLRFIGKENCVVRLLKVQRQVYISEDKELSIEDYKKMIQIARELKRDKLALIIETICATGIRVSELQYITSESLCNGESIIMMKGKTRKILLPNKLQVKLRKYAQQNHIITGSLFVTKSGRPMDRSNIWKMMKKLAELAQIVTQKVFPHNLRHLFARTFYQTRKDIALLADVLGHSNINTTRIYIISSGTEHRKIIDEMHLVY